MDLKFHSRFYLYIASVIFGHGNYFLSCKGELWFSSRGIFLKMSFFHDIDMFRTYFQSFTCYYTSVVIIITKYIFDVKLVISSHKGFCIKESMFPYVLDDIHCVTKCLSVWPLSSSITIHIGYIDPILSQLSKDS